MGRVRIQTLRCLLLVSWLMPSAIGGGAHPAKQETRAFPLTIHHINVSQGSSVLLLGPTGTSVLIDGGKPGRGADRIVPYLMSIGIMPWHGLDYMVATHHDDDHVGGLDEVILENYDVRRAVFDNGSAKSDDEVEDFRNAVRDRTTAGIVQPMTLGAKLRQLEEKEALYRVRAQAPTVLEVLVEHCTTCGVRVVKDPCKRLLRACYQGTNPLLVIHQVAGSAWKHGAWDMPRACRCGSGGTA